jgi:hypothetical protein
MSGQVGDYRYHGGSADMPNQDLNAQVTRVKDAQTQVGHCSGSNCAQQRLEAQVRGKRQPASQRATAIGSIERDGMEPFPLLLRR